MYLVQTVAPTQEPISLAEAKQFCNAFESEDDTLINAMLIASREYAENYTNRQFEVATYELHINDWYQNLQMPKNPIKSIDSITYLDENDVEQTFTDFQLYGDNNVFKIHFRETPCLSDNINPIKITFKAGYTNVPESIKQYIKIKTSTLYENREQFVIGVSVSEMPKSFIEDILSKYRVHNV